MNKTKYWIGRGVKNAILILFSLFCVFPLIWVVIAATNSSVDIVSGVLTPGSHLLENWKTLTENYDVGRTCLNSVKYSVVTTVVAMIVCSIAGYGFEIFHDRFKDKLFGLLMLTMMVPFVATVVPLYQAYAEQDCSTWYLGLYLALCFPRCF